VDADDDGTISCLDVRLAHLIERLLKVPKPEIMRKPMFPLRQAQVLEPGAQRFVSKTKDPSEVRPCIPNKYKQYHKRQVNALVTLVQVQFKVGKDAAARITNVRFCSLPLTCVTSTTQVISPQQETQTCLQLSSP
jgi:hypothetical protein